MKRPFFRGVSLGKRLLLLGLIVSILPSCAESIHVKEFTRHRMIHNVPFHPREDFQCGPASLAAVLNFWGVSVTPEEIARDIYSPSARGTLTLDMIGFPEKKGMKAVHYQGGIDDIRNKIDSGYPLIVLVDLGLLVYQQNHYMVVVGYEENGVVAHSGKEPLKRIPLKNFMKTWSKTKYWTLWIKPLP